jgi:hypothetical protein
VFLTRSLTHSSFRLGEQTAHNYLTHSLTHSLTLTLGYYTLNVVDPTLHSLSM